MAVPRKPGGTEWVLVEVLHDLTDGEIEQFAGKARNTFAKQSNPNDPGRQISLPDAAHLDAALVSKGLEPRFLMHMRQTIENLTGRAATASVNIPSTMHALNLDIIELNAAIGQAMEDGSLTLEERRRVEKEAQDVIDRATSIRDSVSAPAPYPKEVG
jgi:hypothetical protein